MQGQVVHRSLFIGFCQVLNFNMQNPQIRHITIMTAISASDIDNYFTFSFNTMRAAFTSGQLKKNTGAFSAARQS